MLIHQLPEIEEYIISLSQEARDKIVDLIRLLGIQNGRLNSGHTKHLSDKIWELRLEYDKKQHRILYTIINGKIIILLIAFTKKTKKTPPRFIERAIQLRKILNKKFK